MQGAAKCSACQMCYSDVMHVHDIPIMLLPFVAWLCTHADAAMTMVADIATIKRLVTASSQATRHAAVINDQDLDELEKSLHICFVPVTPENLSEDVTAALEDPIEFEWEDNRHEARHRKEYLAELEKQVGAPGCLLSSCGQHVFTGLLML